MTELDEKRVREIVKEEIGLSRVPERLAVIESKLDDIQDKKADKSDIGQLNLRIDTLAEDQKSFKKEMKEDMKEIKKYIIGFTIAVIVAVIGAALAK